MTAEEEKLFDESEYSRKGKKDDFKQKTKNLKYHQNYFIIIILSFISLVFLPMLGSEGDITFNIPSTPAGFLIWVLSKASVIILNLLIFTQFVKQAKVNVREHPLYLEAERLLNLIDLDDGIKYFHPNYYIDKMKKDKKVSLFVTSTLSIFGFGRAILNFDWLTMLTYLFTVGSAVVFGWITMLDTEDIWTFTYIKYAKQEYKKYLERIEIEKALLEPDIPQEEIEESDENIIDDEQGGSNGVTI